MKLQEARQLGDRVGVLIADGREQEACNLLFPVLLERTAFRLLDAIGERLGNETLDTVAVFLDQIANQRLMGGWVVIASALRQQLSRDLQGAFERCRGYVILADVWYATDTFGERLPGPALVENFEPSLALLSPWREDSNRWVRRITGVAVHYWAKQAHGSPRYEPQTSAVLDFLTPMFTEREIDAIKGVGWGLKTLGRYYPELVADWLLKQAGRPHRALMVRKATTYLPFDLRQQIAVRLT